ncbi:MAG: ElyC/SanA/YdcF family protein [Candidatus Marinarcus sp.]|uniref:ElyC/SanA/YdcF family protein n=1 Tax=Candidatus Marinarcus sp. TaxID=3100987 RepID=UPI003AFF753F
MGFTLKKIISLFIMPISIGLILFLYGLLLLFTNSYKKAKVYLFASFVWFFLISFAPFSNALVTPLENFYPAITSENPDVKYILLLGGDFERRGYEALRLYYKMDNIKIITSGYEGANSISEAKVNAQKLLELGVAKENILIQEKPKDTRQEAQEVKNIVNDQPFILVTSALHMPRAMLLFKNEGLNPIAAPTDFISDEKYSFYESIGAQYALNTQKAIHEYIGIVWSFFKDVIQTFRDML